MKKTKLLLLSLGIVLCAISCKDSPEMEDSPENDKGEYTNINDTTISLEDVDEDSDIYMFVYNTADSTKSYKEYSNIFNASESARSAISPAPTVYDSQIDFDDEFAHYTCGLSLKTVRNATKGKSIKRRTAARNANGEEEIYERDVNKYAATEIGEDEVFYVIYTNSKGEESITPIAAIYVYSNDVCQVFVQSEKYNEDYEDNDGWEPSNYYYDDETIKDSYYPKDYKENYDSIKITPAGVKKLADKFSEIYKAEQALLGDANLDFIEGNSNIIETSEKITILVSNIGKKSNSATLGYFYPEDLRCDCDEYGYIEEGSNTYVTNQRLMFTVNTIGYASKFGGEDAMLSTLAHEFNHMLNYINKNLKYDNPKGYETWFTEMLSVTTEDFAYKYLGTSNTVQKARLRYFLRYPYSGMINWEGTDVSNSYGFAYAFGAYLVRNYGGTKLLNKLATSKYAEKEAITEALKACGYNETYESVLQKFGTVFVNADGKNRDLPTLNKNISEKHAGYSYSFPSVDLYTYSCKPSSESAESFTKKLANPKWTSSYFNGPCFYKPSSPPENLYAGGFFASYLGKVGDYGDELSFTPPTEKSGLRAYIYIE